MRANRLKKRLRINKFQMSGFLTVLNNMFYATIVIFVTGSCHEKGINKPIRVSIDLNAGEELNIQLSNGENATIKLTSIEDSVNVLDSSVRLARARVVVNGQPAVLNVGNYTLPATVGDVQIDCPVVKAYLRKSSHNSWKLHEDARLRLWPKGSHLLEPGTFVYPIKQRIFANNTQMGNEPVYVDGGEMTGKKAIYYHAGLDFGGSEGRDEIVSTVEGIVIISGDSILPEYKESFSVRYDKVVIVDKRGWFHSYSHMQTIDPGIIPGKQLAMGQKIGILGKEGFSGGWTHVHYSIRCKRPSGEIGEEDAFPYVWEAYMNEHKPSVIALARPHIFAPVGKEVVLDGSKSKSFEGEIRSYEWTFHDGTSATGQKQKRRYSERGTYSEVLKVEDSEGNIDYDYTVVQILNADEPEKLPPTIHAVYYPTTGIKAGNPITFGVRTFRTKFGEEKWDFGDGTEEVIIKSEIPEKVIEGRYAETIHRYSNPGHYIARVERTNENGFKAIAHLHVEVE